MTPAMKANLTRRVGLRFSGWILNVLLLARKRPTPRVIRAMDLPVAIGTTAIEGPYVQSLSGGRRMARQHVNVALLAQQMNARSQELGIARTMRRVTVQAIFAHRWV